MAPTDRFVAETTFHIRYAETDAMAIVHHANYIVYFEEGRSHYMRQRGSSYTNFVEAGYYLAVSEVNARYIKPAQYDQRLTIRCWIEEFKSRRITFAYEIVNADTGDLHVTGLTRHICITPDGNVARIPEEWRMWGTGMSNE